MTKETAVSGVVAMVGFVANSFLGGWDIGLKILIFCMVFDFITGVLVAIKQKKLRADEMFWGGIKKAVILAVLALAVMLDEMVGNDSPIFRMLAIYFYVGKEGLSVIENLSTFGVRFPKFLTGVLSQFADKGDQVDGTGGSSNASEKRL